MRAGAGDREKATHTSMGGFQRFSRARRRCSWPKPASASEQTPRKTTHASKWVGFAGVFPAFRGPDRLAPKNRPGKNLKNPPQNGQKTPTTHTREKPENSGKPGPKTRPRDSKTSAPASPGPAARRSIQAEFPVAERKSRRLGSESIRGPGLSALVERAALVAPGWPNVLIFSSDFLPRI